MLDIQVVDVLVDLGRDVKESLVDLIKPSFLAELWLERRLLVRFLCMHFCDWGIRFGLNLHLFWGFNFGKLLDCVQSILQVSDREVGRNDSATVLFGLTAHRLQRVRDDLPHSSLECEHIVD